MHSLSAAVGQAGLAHTSSKQYAMLFHQPWHASEAFTRNTGSRQRCRAIAPQEQQRWQQQQRQAVPAQQHDRRFDDLATWLEARGGSVGAITAGDCQMGPVVVRGLVTTQDLSPSTPVLSVPVSSTLQDTRAPEPYPSAPWNVCLAAQLLEERSKGHSSSHWPYLATLPSSCCSPLLLPQHQLSEVQYEPAVAAIAAFQAAAREAYAKLQQQQQQQWTWEEWAWALHMVQSRSIRLAQMGCKVMIPGIDLLNHGGSAANGQLVLGKASWQVEGEPAVCFVTTQHIQAGEQVLWSYGRRGNDDFFCYHGFVLTNNPDEDVVLFSDVGQLVQWAVQNVPKLSCLQGQEQQSLAVAEAAAYSAAQEASAHCSSAAIPGTSSSLLAPIAALTRAVQQQLQRQQEQQHGGERQHQQQERWSAQLLGSRSSSWRSSSSSGECGQLERAVLAGFKGLQLERRLASFRLHSPEWGASTCPPSTPDLVLRQDGCVDVRLPAVLAALLDKMPAVSSSSSSSSSSHDLAAVLQDVLRVRCQQMLRQMPTSVEQDQEWLQQDVTAASTADGGLLSAVVQYRLAKKNLLAQFA